MRHYEAKIKDLEVEIFQQRNLNNELERMLRDLIGKFKKQKRKIRSDHDGAVNALIGSISEAEETLAAVDRAHIQAKTELKSKVVKHKKKRFRNASSLSVCEKNLIEALADIDFFEDSLAIVAGENVHLHERYQGVSSFLQYCKVSWKYKFKQWWTGIYHIDKLGEDIGFRKYC